VVNLNTDNQPTKTCTVYKNRVNKIEIDIELTRDAIVGKSGLSIMQDRYYQRDYDPDTQTWTQIENSAQECFARSATTYASNQEHAQRLYNYISKMWFMPATPILANALTNRGLPISCFLSDVQDSVEGLLDHYSENGFLSSYGGGIGSNWSKVRSIGSSTSRGNVSTGLVPFVRVMDAQTLAFQQGSTRRGAYAAYLSASHPEIEEFVKIRRPQSDDLNRRCLGEGFHHAVNIPDVFMEAVSEDAEWNLTDPHSGQVVKTVKARELWMQILLTRLETGEPYIHFEDTSNKALPKALQDKGLKINNTNLCTEIFLPTAEDRTAVCCLSSVNLEYYNEWKDNPLFIQDIMEFLDNVLESFITTAPPSMWRAINSAQLERSVGLGAMGFHTYLQKNNIPFESPVAIGQNLKIFKHINEKALEANLKLGKERGEAPDMKGTGRRFAHMMAVAPNANISLICGEPSPSIEPFNANAFTQKTLSGSFLIKNKVLDKLLKEKYGFKEDDLEEIWGSIITSKGSVQHLEFLEDSDKDVFKTALELNQEYIIEHAAKRQPYICQGQSVNLFFEPTITKAELYKVHKKAWESGLKSLYYLRSAPVRRTELFSKDRPNPTKKSKPAENESIVKDHDFREALDSSCVACEG